MTWLTADVEVPERDLYTVFLFIYIFSFMHDLVYTQIYTVYTGIHVYGYNSTLQEWVICQAKS